MDIHSRPVVVYRWVVFAMAAGYTLYELATGDYSRPGGPFRFLTIWALLLSFYTASRMLALSEFRIERSHQVTAMCASVLNIMVVFLYWKLFLEDPALVNSNGHIPFLEQYYLHALGPLLQLIDALFVARVFQRVWRAILPLIGLIIAYVAWSELVVQRFNSFPSGPVTSGLPYPFLNALELPERMIFYASNGAIALVLLAVLWILQKIITQMLPNRAAIPS